MKYHLLESRCEVSSLFPRQEQDSLVIVNKATNDPSRLGDLEWGARSKDNSVTGPQNTAAVHEACDGNQNRPSVTLPPIALEAAPARTWPHLATTARTLFAPRTAFQGFVSWPRKMFSALDILN